MPTFSRRYRAFRVVVVSTLIVVLASFEQVPGRAQDGARYFVETGKTVGGRFLEYWNGHGGLAQQGYPISEEMREKSDADGRIYTVQYFERAVFELHPEN